MALVQVAQRATELDRASAFYSLLLEQNPVARFDPPGLLFFDLDGVRLLLDLNAPTALLYFKVNDLHSQVQRLAEAGVQVVSEPHVIFRHSDDTLGPSGTDEWQAFVLDSEGNTVGLVEWRAAP